MSIETNLSKIRKEIGEAELVVVTKNVPLNLVEELYRLGCRDFGESRVQEALEKIEKMPKDCRWHFIGHLQKNKVTKAVGRFVLIHSVDSVELLQKISDESVKRKCVTQVLLQVNTSGEKTKGGLNPGEWRAVFPQLCAYKGVEIKGVMTMAPLTEREEDIRQCFRNLKVLADELKLPIVSMGMSHDYHIALEEGATHLRIGSAIFQ